MFRNKIRLGRFFTRMKFIVFGLLSLYKADYL